MKYNLTVTTRREFYIEADTDDALETAVQAWMDSPRGMAGTPTAACEEVDWDTDYEYVQMDEETGANWPSREVRAAS